ATMLLGGLWHGANWTFVLWGAIHGTGLAVERRLGRPVLVTGAIQKSAGSSPRFSFLATWTKRIAIFQFVCFAWIFFRAASIHGAFRFLAGLGVLSWRPEWATAAMFLGLFSLPLFLLDLRMDQHGEEYPFEKIGLLYQRGGYRQRVAVAACGLLLVA